MIAGIAAVTAVIAGVIGGVKSSPMIGAVKSSAIDGVLHLSVATKRSKAISCARVVGLVARKEGV